MSTQTMDRLKQPNDLIFLEFDHFHYPFQSHLNSQGKSILHMACNRKITQFHVTQLNEI